MEAESFGSADTLVHPSRSLLLRPPALLPRGKKQAFGLLTGAKVEKLSSDTSAEAEASEGSEEQLSGYGN